MFLSPHEITPTPMARNAALHHFASTFPRVSESHGSTSHRNEVLQPRVREVTLDEEVTMLLSQIDGVLCAYW